MTSRTGFGQALIVPIMICLIFVSGFVIYRHNKLIMSQVPLLSELTKSRGERGLFVNTRTVENITPFSPSVVNEVTSIALRPNSEYQPVVLADKPAYWSRIGDLIIHTTPKEIAASDSTGNRIWSFRITDSLSFSDQEVAISHETIWASTVDGRLYALDIKSGELVWYANSEDKFIRMPILYGDKLVLFCETKSTSWGLKLVDAKTGREVARGGEFELPFAGSPVLHESGVMYYTTTTGHVVAVDLAKIKVLWSHEGSPSFRARPTLYGDRLLAVNEDGIIFSFDRKNGKKHWEVELGTLVHSPITVLAATGFGITVDVQGYLIGVDLKAGKRKWRHATHQTGADREISIIRVAGSTPNGLSREARNHFVAAGCNSDRLCLYDPFTGYLLYRLESDGKVISGVQSNGASEVFLTSQQGRQSRILKLQAPNKAM